MIKEEDTIILPRVNPRPGSLLMAQPHPVILSLGLRRGGPLTSVPPRAWKGPPFAT